MSQPEEDTDWDDCEHCFGSGRDRDEWDGRCVYCHGAGRVVRYYSDDHDNDETR